MASCCEEIDLYVSPTSCSVVALDKNGAPDKSQTAEKMLSLLLNQLK